MNCSFGIVEFTKKHEGGIFEFSHLYTFNVRCKIVNFPTYEATQTKKSCDAPPHVIHPS